LREVFGIVPQDPSLFNISLLENIRYARVEATDEEVKQACRAAAIHDRIISFPDGYQTKVGERGVKLSGGELQRVAIARAILRDPRIILLDEATSSVDTETEAAIQEAFRHLTKGRTTFVVAHRLSTIQHADLILVVHNGQIVERGTHEQLYALNGKYTGLWSKQLSKEST
jgi:ABC-type multidrug transport system fused ATPase/permease subunit